jgi:restriction endonuclease S subunit
MFNGSVIGNISKDRLNNLQIPFPIDIKSIKSLLNQIETIHSNIIDLNNQIPIKEKEICMNIKKIIEEEDCDEFKLGDICEIKSGKAIKSNNRNGNLYPYYAANGISGYIDEYIFDGNYILCAQDGSIGATHLVNNKFYASNHVWVLKTNNFNTYYVYYILKYIKNYSDITSGSVIPKLTKEKIEKIEISIPKDKSIILDLEKEFQMIDNYKETLAKLNIDYKLKLDELFRDFPNTENDEIIEESITTKETNDDIIIESKKKLTKKTDNIVVKEKK